MLIDRKMLEASHVDCVGYLKFIEKYPEPVEAIEALDYFEEVDEDLYVDLCLILQGTDDLLVSVGDNQFAKARPFGKCISGKNGVSACGDCEFVASGLGGVLILEGYDKYHNWIKKCVIVDGEKIKPDTFYFLEEGKLVEKDRKNPENFFKRIFNYLIKGVRING